MALDALNSGHPCRDTSVNVIPDETDPGTPETKKPTRTRRLAREEITDLGGNDANLVKRLSEARTAGIEMAMAIDGKREDDGFWWDVRVADQKQDDSRSGPEIEDLLVLFRDM